MTVVSASRSWLQTSYTLQGMNKIEIVQVLRGFAAFFVMVYHLKDALPPDHWAKKGMDLVFNFGPAGVDLFFIISGFLMVLISPSAATGKPYQSVQFLLKRLIRIWPLYFLVTIGFYFTINALHYYPESIQRLIKSLLFIPLAPEDPPFFGHAFLLVGWTLNYEMYFYLLVAALLPFGRFKWAALLGVMLVTLVGIPLAFSGFTLDPSQQHLFRTPYLNLVTSPMIWDFVSGVLIGIAFRNPRSNALLERVFRNPYLVMIVLVTVTGLMLSGFFWRHGPTQWGAAMSLIFVSLLFYSTARQVSYPRLLVYLGDISYSVYLLHIPVLVASGTVFKWVGIGKSAPVGLIVFALVLTLAASHFSYQIVEKKGGEMLRRILVGPGK